MGDFNARVEEGSDGKMIGKYGLGKRIDREQMLSDFVKRIEHVVSTRKETTKHMNCSSSKKKEECSRDCC